MSKPRKDEAAAKAVLKELLGKLVDDGKVVIELGTKESAALRTLVFKP